VVNIFWGHEIYHLIVIIYQFDFHTHSHTGIKLQNNIKNCHILNVCYDSCNNTTNLLCHVIPPVVLLPPLSHIQVLPQYFVLYRYEPSIPLPLSLWLENKLELRMPEGEIMETLSLSNWHRTVNCTMRICVLGSRISINGVGDSL
jgi:hypothetical protein